MAVTRLARPTTPRPRFRPYPEYKDSGVEWLGKIPAHWEVGGLKTAFWFGKGRNAQMLTATYIQDHPGKYPVYSGQTENDGIMGFVDSYEYEFDEVLFSTTVGARAMTPMVLRGRFNLSQNCLTMVARNSTVSSRFFYYQLHPCFAFERAGIPDHMQPSLRIADLIKYQVGFPPPEEQQSIAVFLDKRTAAIDILADKIREAIGRLKEYRTALISATVTGKIDVREEVV